AQHRGFELAVRDVEHDALAEADGIEVAPVLAQRDLRERAGLEIVHERLGDARMGAFAQVLDAGDVAGRFPHSSPRAAMSAMRSPMRQASAWMVSDGLTPPLVGNSEPSHTHRLGIDQLRPSLSTTLSWGSSPMRHPPIRCEVSSSTHSSLPPPASRTAFIEPI